MDADDWKALSERGKPKQQGNGSWEGMDKGTHMQTHANAWTHGLLMDTERLLHGHPERRHTRHTWQCAKADKDHTWRATYAYDRGHLELCSVAHFTSCPQFAISHNPQIR